MASKTCRKSALFSAYRSVQIETHGKKVEGGGGGGGGGGCSMGVLFMNSPPRGLSVAKVP